MVEKIWNLLNVNDEALVDRLSGELNMHPLIAKLLFLRGIRSAAQAQDFFEPRLDQLHDPMLMKDMDKAVARVQVAMDRKERIMVYGDYDVDGTTSVALVYSFLKKLHPEVMFYIPDRYKEGYGISFQGIDVAEEKGVKLIVALDCGIKSADKVAYAREKGIDFIICDHHLPGTEIPQAAAVLDPKRSDCTYPYKDLCGCGIGYKLVQAIAKVRGMDAEDLEEYLDLVVVAIAADIVPMTGENRVLAHFGLKQINAAPRAGFAVLKEIASLKRPFGINDIVFVIAPRINAAGRIESGNRAVELLLTTDREKAFEVANIINKNNLDRRELDTGITQEAKAILHADPEQAGKKTTVVHGKGWHKGVVGIVASRLTDVWYRPTIVLTENDGVLSGSARSVRGFDVHAAIDACGHLLEQYGGHMAAAGLSLKSENLERFKTEFDTVVRNMHPEPFVPQLDVDALLSLEEINQDLFRLLQKFQPFGPGNLSPVFASKEVIDTGYGKVVGTNHLRLTVQHPRPPYQRFGAIGFGLGAKLNVAMNRKAFDIAYAVEENEFNGRVSLQLNLKDIR